LPAREWSTGFAEIVKYGVIKDRSFFEWLEKKVQKNARPQKWAASDVLRAIQISAAIKAKVVSGDEREKPLGGGREILNFGHTIGHALEAASAYNAVSHGEAISIGMIAVGFLVLSKKGWGRNEQLRLLSMLDALGLPTTIKFRVDKKRFWSALHADKKNIGGKLRFILPKAIGRVEVRSGIQASDVRNVLLKMGFNT
jgi:3-dehydroquinate synthase